MALEEQVAEALYVGRVGERHSTVIPWSDLTPAAAAAFRADAHAALGVLLDYIAANGKSVTEAEQDRDRAREIAVALESEVEQLRDVELEVDEVDRRWRVMADHLSTTRAEARGQRDRLAGVVERVRGLIDEYDPVDATGVCRRVRNAIDGDGNGGDEEAREEEMARRAAAESEAAAEAEQMAEYEIYEGRDDA